MLVPTALPGIVKSSDPSTSEVVWNLTSLKNWSFISSGSIRAGMVKSAFRIPKSCPGKESTIWLREIYPLATWKLQFLAGRMAPSGCHRCHRWFRISKRKKREAAAGGRLSLRPLGAMPAPPCRPPTAVTVSPVFSFLTNPVCLSGVLLLSNESLR